MNLPPPPPPATCPRHPSRAAFRRCTRCERPWCDDCLVRGAVGSLCPDCVKASRPPATERVRRWNATRSTVATYVLIGLNGAVAVYTLSTPKVAGIHRGEFDLAVNRWFVDSGEWWRIITSGFTHFGVVHLAMNMIGLYFLGQFVEPALGRAKFVALYLAALLAGTAGALVLQPSYGITAGASGAVFGLLGAAAVGLRHRGIGLMQTGIGTTILLNLLLTFSISGISIGGHLGGLAGGAICGYVMLAPRHRGFPAWLSWATPAAVAAVSVVICFAVSSGTVCGSRFC